MKRLLTGLAYIATVIGANWAIGHLGTAPTFPGAPHTLPVGFGYTAPSGVIFVALALILRDALQYAAGKAVMLCALAAAAALSYAVAGPAVATASAVAFLFSELADFALFTWVAPRWARAVLAGGIAGAIVDSAIFLGIAFGSLAFWQGQVVGKAYGVILAAVVIAIVRHRRGRPSLVERVATADVHVNVRANVEKQCPIKHEGDFGRAEIAYRTRGGAYELHDLADYLDAFKGWEISHEDFTDMLARELGAHVVTTWETAGLLVEVTSR